MPASHAIGRSHSVNDIVNYYHRIDAVNYALGHDDGIASRGLGDADIILVGVSRSGKTPTCLHMAMQFGIRAANYPFVREDFDSMQLPRHLQPLRARLRGLTIKPERLQQIRSERRPGSTYATLQNCEFEVRAKPRISCARRVSRFSTRRASRSRKHDDHPPRSKAGPSYYRLDALCLTRSNRQIAAAAATCKGFGLPRHWNRDLQMRGVAQPALNPAPSLPKSRPTCPRRSTEVAERAASRTAARTVPR